MLFEVASVIIQGFFSLFLEFSCISYMTVYRYSPAGEDVKRTFISNYLNNQL